MLDDKKRFVIEDYEKKSAFASFLPGISGPMGIPIWCYYVNRGQCVTSFGVEDKDHSIMEFFPAHQSYHLTKRMGFRTLMKVDGEYMEPFADTADDGIKTRMSIGMNELELIHRDENRKIETTVRYFTLPGEEVGALVRKVTVTNLADEVRTFEVLDGMPAVIPYGVDLNSMKAMGQTTKAWMEVLNHENKIPVFHVRVGMEDTAQVKEIQGVNFAFAYSDQSKLMPVIVSNQNIFDYDTSLERAYGFESKDLLELLKEEQMTQNDVPCCFFARKRPLQPGGFLSFSEVFGQAESRDILDRFFGDGKKKAFFDKKYQEAIQLTQELTDKIATHTGMEVFDLYCRQTYLDNVLRGGFPVIIGGDKIFYLYSRKHGDIERDYNYFKMLPEYFSQGNGNFRDVNQNRRCDVQFAPFVRDENIKTFYNLIQINGYNPLAVEKITFRMPRENLKQITKYLRVSSQLDALNEFLTNSFTPGGLYKKSQEFSLPAFPDKRDLVEKVISLSVKENKSSFGEGYWSDHWTYNLDLIESYLAVYPDDEERLLFEDGTYTYAASGANLLSRDKRYVKTDNGIRQYHFLDKLDKAGNYLTDAAGHVVKATLIEKLLLLCTTKMAALDPYGMGVEMEGGKPGWYDALNGLPGLLGSSMAETYELARMVGFTLDIMERYPHQVAMLDEISLLMERVCKAVRDNREELEKNGQIIRFWNQINDAKEVFWEQTRNNVSGSKTSYAAEPLIQNLRTYLTVLNRGVIEAVTYGEGISPTYFYYNVTKYDEVEQELMTEIVPLKFEMVMMPYFLEGPVRYLKLDMDEPQKRGLYNKVKESGLYDEKLHMYKVNASLKEASFELGRCKAFTPGWLENESIWLHMEYKYLLELLKSGLYPEFEEDFHEVLVPFQSFGVYKRSLLENSSFMASSANPDKNIHGKGFVARLSGSTVEFIQMWQIMMFGIKPFSMYEGVLQLEFRPMIPEYLIGSDGKIEGVFLGEIPVTYLLEDQKTYMPGNYIVEACTVRIKKEEAIEVNGSVITGELAERIRNLEVDSIEVILKR